MTAISIISQLLLQFHNATRKVEIICDNMGMVKRCPTLSFSSLRSHCTPNIDLFITQRDISPKVSTSCTAKAVRRRTIGMETTGEKQSDLVHGLGSRFPSTTIQLLARVGDPLVFLTVKVHIDGMALMLCCLHNR